MDNHFLRRQLVSWLLLMSVLHLLVGLLMTYGVTLPLFQPYHQAVLKAFGFELSHKDALALHQWWVSLFGATLQCVGVLMLVLVLIGKKVKSAGLWWGILFAIVLWAPQDIFISSKIHLKEHYWIDAITVILLAVPLIGLAFIDRRKGIDL